MYDLSISHIHSAPIFWSPATCQALTGALRRPCQALAFLELMVYWGETDLPPGKHIVSQASWKPCVTHQQESAGLDSNSCGLHLAKAHWLLPRTVGSFLASLSWAPKMFFSKTHFSWIVTNRTLTLLHPWLFWWLHCCPGMYFSAPLGATQPPGYCKGSRLGGEFRMMLNFCESEWDADSFFNGFNKVTL